MFISCNSHIAQQKVKKYYYSCPMHNEVIEMIPGNCPKCGMKLEQYELNGYSHGQATMDHSNHNSSGGHSGGCH